MRWIEENIIPLLVFAVPWLLFSAKAGTGGRTLAERNNNPGNIRYNAANNWRGQIGQSGGFVVFDSMVNGLRAMLKLLINYHGRGYNTIGRIVTRYAPPSENPTGKYIEYVSRCSGVPSSYVLDVGAYHFYDVVRCMVDFESGGNILITYSMFMDAKRML